MIHIKKIGKVGKGNNLDIDIRKKGINGIKKQGDILYIREKTGEQAKDMTRKLLRVLDKKYVWFGKFGYRSPFEPAYVGSVLKEKGLTGTILN